MLRRVAIWVGILTAVASLASETDATIGKSVKTFSVKTVADFPNAIAMRIHTHPKWPILPKIAFTAGFNCLPMITNRRDRPISKI